MRRFASIGLLGLPSVLGQAFQLQAAKLQSECGTLYKVVTGDGCWSISGAAHITQEQLAALNPGLDCATLQAGQGLCLALPCSKTYEVVTGDWCAKIEEEQKIAESDLMSLNPGFDCGTIFAGQRLCLAAPTTAPPGDPIPPLDPVPPAVYPTSPCKKQIALVQGDTCYDVATANGLQLAQFMELNKNLDCDTIQAGNIVCVLPACGEIYWVDNGDWCAQIETDHGLASGQLVKLNPALSCDALAPGQVLCVEPPPAEQPEEDSKPSLDPWEQFAPLSPGTTLLQSPLIDFLNADNPRDTFFGEMMFQLDGQHRLTFQRVDTNGDGKLDSTELEKIVSVSPVFTRGLSNINADLATDKIVNQIITSMDGNGDGVVSEDEYIFSVYKVQQVLEEQEQTTLRRRAGEHMPVKRDLPSLLLPVGIAGLSAAQIADLLGAMERKAGKDSELLKYLDVGFWNKAYQPEPKCSAILYWSSSCGEIQSNAAAKCSEGGWRVFDNSCRDFIGDGAKQCAMNKCASLCYKINTDDCSCDSLDYTFEEKVIYNREIIKGEDGESMKNNVGECRALCSKKSECVGFSVGVNIDGATVTCRIYDKFEDKITKDNSWITYTKVNKPSGSDKCPAIPDGYYPVSASQVEHDIELGEKLADKYSEQESLAKRSNLSARAPPDSYDQRTKIKLTRKNQSGSGLCASFTFTTVVEGGYYNKFNAVSKELSPLWIAMCAAEQKSYKEGNTIDTLAEKVSSSLIASEDCVPFKSRDNLKCDNNCFINSYLPLPYVSDYIWFPPPAPDNPKEVWDQMKQHLINVGPIWMGFQVGEPFTDYARDLSGHGEEIVYYDGHPDWPTPKDCVYGGHAMTIIGYGHFKKDGKGRNRLYWIVQNSWGISSGQSGYIFIAAGSMGTSRTKAVGMKVNRRHGEL